MREQGFLHDAVRLQLVRAWRGEKSTTTGTGEKSTRTGTGTETEVGRRRN